MKRLIAVILILLCGCARAEGYPRYFETAFSSVAELKAAGLEKALEVEQEGIVLLKNEKQTLPLAAGTRVSLFGITCVDPVYGGTGSGAVATDSASDFVQSFEAAGLQVANTELIGWYREEKAEDNLGRSPYAIGEGKWSKVKRRLDDNDSQIRGTAAFFILGRVGGEGSDMTNGAQKEDAAGNSTDYLRLNEAEESVLLGLKALKDEGIIASLTVIFNSANPVSCAFLFDGRYGVDAALWVGSVGQAGVDAAGQVISGQVNPSGCLPDTWWMDNLENPVMAHFGARAYADADDYFPGRSYYECTRYTVYQEGIYLGYRYTETRYTDVMEARAGAGEFDYDAAVAFPFGFGLSYTTFSLNDMRVERTGEGRGAAYAVSVSVTNTGEIPGKKAVQVYAQKPYTRYDQENAIEKPAVELAGFAKTGLLRPGDSQTLTIRVPEYYLTAYDAENTEAFILDEGVYALACAENAHDAARRFLTEKNAAEPESLSPCASDPLVWRFPQRFDGETYAASFGTGEEVSSLFSFADINRYDGAEDNAIPYYSRSDWAGAVTKEEAPLTMTDLMAIDLVLTDDSLPEGDEFPVLGEDHGLQLIDLLDADFGDSRWDDFMDQFTFEELEKICLTGLRQTAVVERLGKPRTVDHNGPTGVTQPYSIGLNGYAAVAGDPEAHLCGTCYPCNGILAAAFNEALIEEVGQLVGEDAMWAGYAGIYGPGLNLHRSPYAGRVFEYFSEDSLLTGLMGAAWTKGVQSKGVYVYCKHLALNEQEENRAGLGTWCNEQALRELYLRAFELPIVYADAKCVMSAFNRLGPVWCGACPELLTDWLRHEVGMKGFAVTDMFDRTYMRPVNEIAAGNDIPDGELLAYFSLAPYAEEGETPNAAVVQAMRLSAKRVLYTVLHSRGMDGTRLKN